MPFFDRFRHPTNAIEDPPGFDPPIYPQAQWDTVDADILNQADYGEGVLAGCEVHPSSPEANTVDVDSGQVVIGGDIIAVSAQADVAIATPNATQPRFDLVTVDVNGDVIIVQGLPAAISPQYPHVPDDSVALATIYVEADLDAITADHLTNKRANVQEPLGNISDWQRVTALSDLARSNTASLAADDTLHFALASGGKYAIRGHVVISALAASDARYGFLGPNSPLPTFVNINSWFIRALSTAPTTRTVNALDTAGGHTMSSTGAQDYVVDFDAIVHNSTDISPDFSFAWAQMTAVVENTIRRAGSYLEYLAL